MDNMVKDFCVYECFCRELNQPSDINVNGTKVVGIQEVT